MDIQRVRNLTTGVLHTEIAHVYEDIEQITGESGVLTHQLPSACRALEPWLRERVTDPRFWNGAWDREHVGEVDLPAMDEAERAAFWQRYNALPSALALIGWGR